MSVSCECCVLPGTGVCDGPIPRPEEPTECRVTQCDLETPTMGWPRPEVWLLRHRNET
jgi:hypothetical protein